MQLSAAQCNRAVEYFECFEHFEYEGSKAPLDYLQYKLDWPESRVTRVDRDCGIGQKFWAFRNQNWDEISYLKYLRKFLHLTGTKLLDFVLIKISNL